MTGRQRKTATSAFADIAVVGALVGGGALAAAAQAAAAPGDPTVPAPPAPGITMLDPAAVAAMPRSSGAPSGVTVLDPAAVAAMPKTPPPPSGPPSVPPVPHDESSNSYGQLRYLREIWHNFRDPNQMMDTLFPQPDDPATGMPADGAVIPGVSPAPGFVPPPGAGPAPPVPGAVTAPKPLNPPAPPSP